MSRSTEGGGDAAPSLLRVLVATRQTQGQEPGDFTWAVPGELVRASDICARDEGDPDGSCGCGRSWVGLASGLATTTALVAELAFTRAAYLAAHVDAEAAALIVDGLGPMDAEQVEHVEACAADLLDVAAELPVGTVVGHRLDEVIVR
ncbi:conserved hypothetical protein [Parafrankia sp. EAN1pec]|uniref:DUF7715 family protein n=1 Tax=Parafrankia sp. (strain EAN1pec) TaxID=298653 RepID=UPI00015D9E16|nr:conserved hypothetical protein [Frankia sp. EAN1pec]